LINISLFCVCSVLSFCPLLIVIVLSVHLRLTTSNYSSGIFKHFEFIMIRMTSFEMNSHCSTYNNYWFLDPKRYYTVLHVLPASGIHRHIIYEQEMKSILIKQNICILFHIRIDQDWTGGEKKKLANNYFSIFWKFAPTLVVIWLYIQSSRVTCWYITLLTIRSLW
jgi:hypothetical protein